MSVRYTVEVQFEPGEGMGFDGGDEVIDVIEEALRDTGMDSAGDLRVRLVMTSEVKVTYKRFPASEET